MALEYDIPIRYLSRAWFTVPPRLDARLLSSVSQALETEFELRSIMRGHPQMGIASQATALVSPGTGWTIITTDESVDVELSPVSTGGPDPALVARIPELMELVVGSAQTASYRLAIVQEGFLREMSGREMDDFAKGLIRFPSAFSPVPFEWDWRVAQLVQRTIGGKPEATNTIASVRRMHGTITSGANVGKFDRIRLDLDINTLAEDAEPRFDRKNVREFFQEAPAWNDLLRAEINNFTRTQGHQ